MPKVPHLVIENSMPPQGNFRFSIFDWMRSAWEIAYRHTLQSVPSRQQGSRVAKNLVVHRARQSVTSNQQLATRNQEPGTSNQEPATSNQQPGSTPYVYCGTAPWLFVLSSPTRFLIQCGLLNDATGLGKPRKRTHTNVCMRRVASADGAADGADHSRDLDFGDVWFKRGGR